jgi:hypothetical protein
MLSDGMGAPRDPDMEKLFDTVIARGRSMYPDLNRLITSVHVSVDDEGDCTVQVISAV